MSPIHFLRRSVPYSYCEDWFYLWCFSSRASVLPFHMPHPTLGVHKRELVRRICACLRCWDAGCGAGVPTKRPGETCLHFHEPCTGPMIVVRISATWVGGVQRKLKSPWKAQQMRVTQRAGRPRLF